MAEHSGSSGALGLLERAAWFLGRPRSIPYLVLGSSTLLLMIGLMMVWSASSILSLQGGSGSSTTMVFKQALFAALGVALLVVIARLPMVTLRRLVGPLLVITIVLLVLVLVPGIGVSQGGQRNWIELAGFRIQPSELAKLSLALWGADKLAADYRRVTDWREFLVPVLPVGAALILLVLAEGDFGNAMILAVILAVLLFVAGAPLRIFALGLAVSLVGVAVLAWLAPYRIERFTAFLDPSADPLKGAWQVTQGMYAFGTGGLFGVGLGSSREKWGTLPAAHTDFIFAVLGEELGLVGTLSVLLLFALLVYAALRLVQLSNDRFVQFGAAAIAGWIMIQVITNIGATLKMLPITGVTLPFVSYGGSSLVVTLMGIGVLLVMIRFVVHGRERPAPKRRGGSPLTTPSGALT